MTLKIGIGTFSGQVTADASPADAYSDVIALAQLSERVGFDALWVSSHHGVANAHVPSPLILLAAVAQATQTIALGTAVVVGPLQHPLRFAEDCAVLDQLSRGRLMVCVGSGWRTAEFRTFGIPLNERGGRTTELAEICQAAWHQDKFSFDGRYYQYQDAVVTPRPYGRLPLFLGGTADKAVARAGRLADGFIGTGTPQAGLDTLRKQVAAFDEAVRRAGRDPRSMAIGFQANVWVTPDGSLPDDVQRAMWNQIAAYIDWHADTDGVADAPLDLADIRRRGFLGTPASVIEQIRPWVQAFPDRELHLLLRLQYPGLDRRRSEESVRLFGTEVIPELRRLHSSAGIEPGTNGRAPQPARH